MFHQYVKGGVGLYMNKINKVLLVYAVVPNKNEHRKIQMLGISYLQSALQSKGIKCERYDGNIDSLSKEELIDFIISNDYDLVGFSILYSNTTHSLEIAKLLKQKKPKIIIVFGGPNATIMHKSLINNNDFIDVVMRGEGENDIISLISDYNLNGKFTNPIPGCSYQNINNKKVFAQKISKIDNLNELVYPDRKNAFDYSRTIIEGEEYYNIDISTSRGCPYQCTFCSVPMFKLNWRCRSVDNVINEVAEICKQQKNIYLIFIDDNFLIDVDRALKIIEEIYKLGQANKTKIPFVFAARADQLLRISLDQLRRIKECGCYSIEVGIENGSDTVLKRMKKNISVQQNLKIINILNKLKINIGIDFILFDNKTTINELKENFDFFRKAELIGYYPAIIYNQMYPYPGTEFAKQKIEMNNYFENKDVGIIYSQVELFARNIQPKIDYLILNKKLNIGDELWLKLLPYLALESFLYNNYNFKQFERENKIYERLYKLKEEN